MDGLRVLAATLAFALAIPVYSQTGERGSLPPGQSRDGAAPADGAIKGGSIAPGETSGIPDDRKMESRCEELEGTLREDCLKRTKETSDIRKRPPARAD